MKKTDIIIAAFATIILAASCAREIVPSQNPGITFKAELPGATADPAVRTSVGDGGAVSWTDSETIGVWDGTSYVAATDVVRSGSTLTFKAAVADGTGQYIAIYPYEAGLVGGSFAGVSEGKVTINPTFTSQTQGTVNVGVATVASPAETFSFHNVTNIVRFSTSRKDVGFVRFTGNGSETLYARLLANPSTGVATLTGDGTGTTLTAELSGAGTYCLALGQGVTLPSGFKLEFFTDSGMTNYLGKVEGTKSASFASQNTSVNLGNIDARIEPLFSYVWWCPEGDETSIGNNLGLSTSDYPVNMFSRFGNSSQAYKVKSSDIPAGATVSYTKTESLAAGKGYGDSKIGDINASTGRLSTYGGNKNTRVAGCYITVTVKKDGLTASKNFPFFVRRYYYDDGDYYSILYNPFVLLANGKKANSLPAPTVMRNGSAVTEFSLSVKNNMYFTNIDGPAEHTCTHKLQNTAPYNTEYMARVQAIYYAKLGKSPNYGVNYPFFTYYKESSPSMTMDEHHAISPMYIDTDLTVHIPAEGVSENFWKDDYGYPNGFLQFGVMYKPEAGVDPTGGTESQIPFVVYFNEGLDY